MLAESSRDEMNVHRRRVSRIPSLPESLRRRKGSEQVCRPTVDDRLFGFRCKSGLAIYVHLPYATCLGLTPEEQRKTIAVSSQRKKSLPENREQTLRCSRRILEGGGSYVFFKGAVYLLLILPAIAQPQAFVTITIKPSRFADARNARMRVWPNGDLVARAIPVLTLLSYAYDVPTNPSPRLSGLPDWTAPKRYDIEAKAPANAVPFRLKSEEMRRRTQQMIRQLLADRFKLVMRVENKRMSVYALSVASGGPKLQKSPLTDEECTFDTDPEGCHSFIIGFGHPLHAKAIGMDDIAHYIENWTDLPVVNRTALGWLFTVNTEGWAPMRLPPPPPGAAAETAPFAGLPTIFTVLGKLGLELKQQKDTLPVYTVEHIERPAGN